MVSLPRHPIISRILLTVRETHKVIVFMTRLTRAMELFVDLEFDHLRALSTNRR
jgi:hypothetical protein